LRRRRRGCEHDGKEWSKGHGCLGDLGSSLWEWTRDWIRVPARMVVLAPNRDPRRKTSGGFPWTSARPPSFARTPRVESVPRATRGGTGRSTIAESGAARKGRAPSAAIRGARRGERAAGRRASPPAAERSCEVGREDRVVAEQRKVHRHALAAGPLAHLIEQKGRDRTAADA